VGHCAAAPGGASGRVVHGRVLEATHGPQRRIGSTGTMSDDDEVGTRFVVPVEKELVMSELRVEGNEKTKPQRRSGRVRMTVSLFGSANTITHVKQVRSLCTVYVIPNMNPDGSVKGHLRTNAAGANLNREWNTTGAYEAPTLKRSPEVSINAVAGLFYSCSVVLMHIFMKLLDLLSSICL